MTNPEAAHQRYLLQATWTAGIRDRLLTRLDLRPGSRLLEVGSGTGVIASEISALIPAAVVGLDIDSESVNFARAHDTESQYLVGDGLSLPFPARGFDVTLCHFFLLWVEDPIRAVCEMARVTKPGGVVLALAEPDYGGRIDHPAALAQLGKLQTKSLQEQGADPFIGRRLRELFHRSDLVDIRTGVLGGEWGDSLQPESLQSEWKTLRADLEHMVSPSELAAVEAGLETAWRSGHHTLFVPTFYAIGCIPQFA